MELRNLYDVNRNLSELTVEKGQEIPEGLRIVCVCAVITNSKGEFLIQKRVPQKNGKYGLTSGHPKLGETSKEGMLTELSEELGLAIPENELILYNSSLHDEKSFRDLYFYKADFDPSILTFQEEEVESAKWATFEEITALFKDVKFCHTHYADLIKYLDYIALEE